MSRKMGFWAVFALVTGSQIGSGVFLLPSHLAPYGLLSLIGWVISGIGAITLTMVFAQLCSWFPKTGGPHVYIQKAFGTSAAFFTGWTYWVISWVSTTAVIVAGVTYFMPLIGLTSPLAYLLFELILLFAVTALNCRGVSTAGYVSSLISILRIIPLILIPLIALFYFDVSNFAVAPAMAHLTTAQILGRVAFLTMWGFIGVETATTPAESVENPSKTIPRAVIAGTTSVALLYFFNSLGIMGIIPSQTLMNSAAPYADTAQIIFDGNWHLAISAIAAFILIGTLNSWMLTSGQIALGLAQDKLLPSFFGKRNRYDAPVVSLIISALGIVPFLVMTASKSLAGQIETIINFSVVTFLLVYATSCLAFFKLLFQRRQQISNLLYPLLYGSLALGFCSWIIYKTPICELLIASSFILTGIPFYLYYRTKLVPKQP